MRTRTERTCAMWVSALLIAGAALAHATPLTFELYPRNLDMPPALPQIEYTAADHSHPLYTLRLNAHSSEVWRYLHHHPHSSYAVPTSVQANPSLAKMYPRKSGLSSASRIYTAHPFYVLEGLANLPLMILTAAKASIVPRVLNRVNCLRYVYHPFFALHHNASKLDMLISVQPQPAVSLTSHEPYKEDLSLEERYFCHSYFALNCHKSQAELLHLLPWITLIQKVMKENVPAEKASTEQPQIAEVIAEPSQLSPKETQKPTDIITAFASSHSQNKESSAKTKSSNPERESFFKYAHILPKHSQTKKHSKSSSQKTTSISKTSQKAKPGNQSRHLRGIRSYLDRK
jgi:hypothetical protein